MTGHLDVRRDFDPAAWAVAYTSGDFEWILRFVADDATYVNRRLGIDIAGKVAWRELLGQVDAALPQRDVTVRHSWFGDDHVVMEIDYSATSGAAAVEFGTRRFEAAEQLTADVLILVELRDGLISAQRDYWAD